MFAHELEKIALTAEAQRTTLMKEAAIERLLRQQAQVPGRLRTLLSSVWRRFKGQQVTISQYQPQY